MRKSISVILYCKGLVTPWLAAVIPRVVIAQPGSSSSRLNGLFRIQNGGCFLFAHGGHVKRKYKKNNTILSTGFIQNGGKIALHVLLCTGLIQNGIRIILHVVLSTGFIQNGVRIILHVVLCTGFIQNGAKILLLVVLSTGFIQNGVRIVLHAVLCYRNYLRP